MASTTSLKTGVLILADNKTFGVTKQGKHLYKCIPSNPDDTPCLIAYKLNIPFSKVYSNIYILYTFVANEANVGTLVNNLGSVDCIHSYYEYVLYSKHLHISTSQTYKKVALMIDDIPQQIAEPSNLPIYTIDSEGASVFDDAISFDLERNIVHIYIANVAYWLDYFDLWKHTFGVSTIYLPNERPRSMLPSNLEHLCSLNANCPRQVIAFDYDLNTSEFHISKKNIRVNENLSFKEANKRKHIFFETDRHLSANEIVEIYMVLINKSIASLFKLHLITDRNTPSSPIYRITDDYFSNELSNHIDNTAIAGSYAVVRETNYLHITSPIRRWVDVLNSIHLQTLMEIHSFREDAYNAIQIFKENIVERNNDYHNIQKITSNCRILYAIDNNIIKSDAVYDGVLLEDARHVYIPLLKYVGKCPENMDYSVDAYRFKIVYFCDEYSLKKKIRLQQQLN